MLTGLVGVAPGVMTLTQPLVRRSQNLTVLSCDPDTNIAPPQVYKARMCPVIYINAV